MQFLIGRWEGTGTGKPSDAVSGVTSFAFDLDRNIIVRRNTAEVPSKDGTTPPATHNDLLVIYRVANTTSLRAIYFDNENHVISYTLSFPGRASSVILESEAVTGAPRFRLVYELRSDGRLSNEFFIAPPGRDFQKYLGGVLKRVS